MFPAEKIPQLLTAALFQTVGATALETFLEGLEWHFLPGGATLFGIGDDADAMYIVLSGRLRVLTGQSGETQRAIREIGRGETVGELALLTGNPRSATVRAVRDTELARFSRGAFEGAVKHHPQLAGRLLVQIAERQSQGADDSLSKRNVRTIAVLPFDSKVATTQFIERLVAALSKVGSTFCLSKCLALSDGLPCQSINGDGALTAKLNELEANHRFVVYQADVELSSWTERCLRQADRILLVGAAGAVPDTFRRAALIDHFSHRQVSAAVELVLLHNNEFDPKIRADPWLSILPFEGHHQVVPTVQEDINKLVRLVTGSAIGLVLSGGGARGFAHIGILRAFAEGGIPVDYIGGTSMGAVIAAQHASGWDWREMTRENRDQWPRCEPQRNFTLPLVAFNSGRRMDRMLEQMFGAVEIQNLREKFFCVSTNLTRADQHVHHHGLLWKAVRASISIPGIGPPAIEQGEIFVDGGLMNNLPVDVMKKLCEGAVAAVDVSEQADFKSRLAESYAVSGWNLLWHRINPLGTKPDLPNIFNILYRSTTVGSLHRIGTVKTEVDLYLNPPVAQFGIFDWRRIDEIISVGYRYGLEALEKHRDRLYPSATMTRP